MTTEVARRDAAAQPQITTGNALSALVPTSADEAFRLARALASSGDMIPKHFQGKPEATMAAIIKGMEIGLAPMQALSSIAVINGRASLWGDALPALMQRAGHHVDVEIEGTGDNMTAIATLTRGDTGKTIVRRFSIADAKKASLLGKQGPWQQYPQRMISMRARAWAIRDGAADAMMGLSIADEAADHGPNTARDVTPNTPRRGGYVVAQPDPEPEVDEVIDAQPTDDAPTDLFAPTPEQLAQAEAEARAEADRNAQEHTA